MQTGWLLGSPGIGQPVFLRRFCRIRPHSFVIFNKNNRCELVKSYNTGNLPNTAEKSRYFVDKAEFGLYTIAKFKGLQLCNKHKRKGKTMAEILRQMQPKTILHSTHGKRRIGMMLCSILLMGFGISVFSFSGMGVDPFTALNMSVSAKLGLSFGFWQMLVNAVLLLFVARFSKKLINLGTVINMVGVGYVCDFFTAIYDRFLPAPTALPVRLVLMLCGVVLLSLSASLFFTASLGVGPYDAVGFVLRDKSPIPYKWCRVLTDVVCTGVAFLLAGPVGVGTVVTAFCMGPIVAFFNTHVSEKLLNASENAFRPTVHFYDFTRFGGAFISVNGRFAS